MDPPSRQREFHFQILGRTLEHLGSQMYKRRDTAIAELVANGWDAGATEVHVMVPHPGTYDRATDSIAISDNGSGMTEDSVQEDYLVVGRNRRAEGQPGPVGRQVMGRKGIGKLAGFGVAAKMTLDTWRDGELTTVPLELGKLKTKAGQATDVKLDGTVGPADDVPYLSGTKLTLTALKHKTGISPEDLRESLARRFSYTVRGHMAIHVNGVQVEDPEVDLETRFPEATSDEPHGMEEAELEDGTRLRYWYGFSKKVLASSRMRGFTILVNGKTAQAPPFFFFVEGTASGQHGTRYLTGVIEADFLDVGTDDESDLVSTDRQELDWDDERTHVLREWGDKKSRELLREWANRRAAAVKKFVVDDPELKSRIEQLDDRSQQQVDKLLHTLGQADADQDRWKEMAGQLISAYEYRHFHEMIDEIDNLGEDPEALVMLLEHLRTWRTLESRAILAVIEGRLQIVEKFHSMIVQNAPETAGRVGDDNLHDLIAQYPWLLHPDWQALSEERRITSQLREWNAADVDDQDRTRYDFLALSEPGHLVVVEIKRSGHPPTEEELQRLLRYRTKLGKGTSHPITAVFISSDQFADDVSEYRKMDHLAFWTWGEVHDRVSRLYTHFRAVLRGETQEGDWDDKEREVQLTRRVLEQGAYRGPARRSQGLGPQDVDHGGDPNLGDTV